MIISMTQRQLATETMENQLTMTLFDASRKMAADRWLVEVVLQIEVPVRANWFNDKLAPPAPLADMTALLGERFNFEYRDRRTFVDAGEKDALVEKMRADLIAMAPRYYGHPEFAARLISKRYREKVAQRGVG
jgi:hypothetical protein